MATVKVQMTDRQVLTLAASIATCCMVGLEQHMPPHAAIARKVRECEKALMGLAALTGQTLDEDMVDIGTGAWGAAMSYAAKRIKELPNG